MSRTRLTVGAALVCGLAASSVSAAPSPRQLLDQMAARWSAVNDYEVTVDSTALENGKTQSQRYAFAFKKPGMVRLKTLTGPDKGGELCVRPDGQIRGRKDAGVLKVFAITMSKSDKRLLNAEGVGIWAMDFGSEIARLKSRVTQSGTQASVADPDRAGGEYVLTLRYGGGALAGMSARYWVDSRSLAITKLERLRNNVVVDRCVYSGMRLNPGFTAHYFEF